MIESLLEETNKLCYNSFVPNWQTTEETLKHRNWFRLICGRFPPDLIICHLVMFTLFI